MDSTDILRGEMSPRTILMAVSILAAAIAYAGNQLQGDMVTQPQALEGSFIVFQVRGGSIRYCQGAERLIACSGWE
jgi:hypothetical protein